MKIFAEGDAQRVNELRERMRLTTFSTVDEADAVFVLNADEKYGALTPYAMMDGKLIVACSVKKSLAEMAIESQAKLKCHLAGINALPTFLSSGVLEIAFIDDAGRNAFTAFARAMGLTFGEVADSVGMVAPRVLCMIINEACYSFQEKVATKEDIDKAMRSGTGYPKGPFAWCDAIGIRDVYETLVAIRKANGEARYAISPLLQQQYEMNQPFYP